MFVARDHQMSEWSSYPAVVEWAMKGCVLQHCGGAEVAAWEALLEMESLDPNVRENATATATLVVDQPKALKKVQRTVVLKFHKEC